MNYKTSIYIIALLSVVSYVSKAEQIPFSGSNIEVTGMLTQLTITAGLSNIIDIRNPMTKKGEKPYSITTNGNLTRINLTSETMYEINIPRRTNLVCKPVNVAFEGSWYKDQNNYNISISNIQGEVVVDADGYNINLLDVLGPTSIVTYGDIKAKYTKPPLSEMISLDTYEGDITVEIPSESKSNINATAKDGYVVFAESITINADENIIKQNAAVIKHVSKNCTIKLHSENGKYVKVKNIADPTHPELKDQLIKMFIRHQGKKGMSTGSRLDLIEQGYETYINAQPDIRPFQAGPDVKNELLDIFDKYGFPTPKMVDNGYAMSAISIIILSSGPEIMDQHKEDFAKHFGQWLVDVYYKGANARR